MDRGDLNIMVDQVGLDSVAGLEGQVVNKDIMEAGALEVSKVDLEGLEDIMVGVDSEDREAIKVGGDLVDKGGQGGQEDKTVLEEDGKSVGTQRYPKLHSHESRSRFPPISPMKRQLEINTISTSLLVSTSTPRHHYSSFPHSR